MPKKSEAMEAEVQPKAPNAKEAFRAFIEGLRQNGTITPEVAEVIKAQIERMG